MRAGSVCVAGFVSADAAGETCGDGEGFGDGDGEGDGEGDGDGDGDGDGFGVGETWGPGPFCEGLTEPRSFTVTDFPQPLNVSVIARIPAVSSDETPFEFKYPLF